LIRDTCAIAGILLAGVMTAFARPASAAPDPQAVLSKLLSDPVKVEAAFVALRATADKDLEPLLLALCRSAEARRRRFAMAAMVEIFQADAAAALSERLKDDDRNVRIEAAARLLALKVMSDRQLRQALGSEDPEIRCMAADAMVRLGKGESAINVLEELARSQHLATASSARLNLLALGRPEYLDAVARTVRDPKTPEKILTQIFAQIAEEKIAIAAELALRVADSDRSPKLRAQAYWAVADALPDGPAVLHEAIVESDQTVFRVNLLGVLASRSDTADKLRELAESDDAVGRLAKFELLRAGGGRAASWAARQAIALGHPVVVDYILDRAREDCNARGKDASFYTAALLDCIRSARPDAARMTAEHYRLARAATILTDLGTPEAVGGLRRILAGRYSATVRATAAGLLRAKNPVACDLARPLLRSPYDELASDAALVLGSFGDADARKKLEEFIARPERHPTPLLALSSWYLLKIEGRSRAAAAELAGRIK